MKILNQFHKSHPYFGASELSIELIAKTSPYSKHLIKLRKNQVWVANDITFRCFIGWPRWLYQDIKINTRWRCGMRGWIAWGGPQYVTSLFSLSHPLTLSLTWTFLAWTKARMHWKQLIYQMFYEKSIFLTDWIHYCDLLCFDESEMLYI